MIEVNLDTMAIDADSPTQEMIDNGAVPNVHCQVVGGNEMPLADPRNPNRPLRMPSLAVNFQLSKKAALEWAALLKEKAEALPDDSPVSSKLAIVSDLNGVDKVAQFDKNLRQ